MFYQTDKNGTATPLRRAGADSRDAILQVTKIVDDRAKNYHVRPSPDGSRIAFDSDRDGIRGVYIADADGQNVRRVSPDGFAAIPSWSPDGNTLAFVRADAERPDVWNLWTLNLETGALRQVTRRTDGQPWGASWFPDGQRVAYSHEDRLILHDLRTGTERTFPTPRKGHLVRTPAVSPDGERIMFQVERDGAWMLELADGSMRRILEDPTAEDYTWAPDGRRVAFHSRKADEWRVWVMAAR
jgi:TolB protein